MKLADEIKAVVVEQLGINADEVKEDSNFAEDLGADSLDIVELVMEFEERFDVEILNSDIEKIMTVGDAIKYIKKLIL